MSTQVFDFFRKYGITVEFPPGLQKTLLKSIKTGRDSEYILGQFDNQF